MALFPLFLAFSLLLAVDLIPLYTHPLSKASGEWIIFPHSVPGTAPIFPQPQTQWDFLKTQLWVWTVQKLLNQHMAQEMPEQTLSKKINVHQNGSISFFKVKKLSLSVHLGRGKLPWGQGAMEDKCACFGFEFFSKFTITKTNGQSLPHKSLSLIHI